MRQLRGQSAQKLQPWTISCERDFDCHPIFEKDAVIILAIHPEKIMRLMVIYDCDFFNIPPGKSKEVRMMRDQGISADQKYPDTREYGHYLDVMAHDLLNFNQAVLGYLELALGAEPLNDDAQHYIHSAIEQIRNSSQLIEDIRKIAILETLENESMKNTSLNEIVKDSIEELNFLYPDRDIVVTVNEEQKDATVLATDILRDVILTLLTNAVKFDDSERVLIDIALSRPEVESNMIDLIVEDRGSGIPDSLKEALAGEAIAESKTRRARGMGLMLVRAAARRLGGAIILDDRVSGDHSQGAKITVRLPEVRP